MQQLKWIYKGIKEIHRIRPGLMGMTLIRSVTGSLFPFINIYMSSVILNAIVSRESIQVLTGYAILTIALNAACSLITAILNSAVNLRQADFSHLYERHLAQKTIDLDFADLENPEIFQKKQHIQDVRNLNSGGIWKLLEAFPGIISSLVTVIVSISLTAQLFFTFDQIDGNRLLQFICSPAGSVILILLIVLCIFISMYTNSTVTKKMYKIMDGFLFFNRVFSYYLNNYISSYHAGKDIRLYNQKGLIEEESNALFAEANRTFDRLTWNQIRYSGLSMIASVVVLAAVYLFVGLRALAGLFSVGNILLYINSINQFIAGMTNTMMHLTSLRVNKEALMNYFDYMEIAPSFQSGHQSVARGEKESYEIAFCNVSFRYPGTQKDVLKNISFTFNTGKRTALVGVNGSGKTTIIKLLCRLYDPTEGKILLNGVDIRSIEYEDYIALFNVVFQDYKLLAFPLGQNVAASLEYDEKKVISSLEKAGFAERLSKMDKYLETPLYKDFDEDGVEISGGEAQKIAISRALYKEAPFVILDEPTAALDPVAEAEIYGRLNTIIEDKTAVFVSHRLSSCLFCDSILVFSDGQLAQQGSHQELLSDETGIYHSLWHAQAQYYT